MDATKCFQSVGNQGIEGLNLGQDMTPENLPHFERPPINEVAMGVRFPPIEGLLLPHYGAFWSSLRDEFVRSEEASTLTIFDELVGSKSGAPLPRTWLIHKNEHYLIQLQQNIFYFNWRLGDAAQNYPRYATIKPLFYDYLERYVAFLKDEKLPVPEAVNCDLSYVNVIPEGAGGYSKNGFATVFRDMSWGSKTKRYLPPPKGVNWHAGFSLPDNTGELLAKAQMGKRLSDDCPVIRFELNARSPGFNLTLDETETWFDLAHETIVLSFVDLTSEKMRRDVWKIIDATD